MAGHVLSIDYGIGGFGFMGFVFVGLFVGVAVIVAFWLFRAVRGAQHIVEDEPIEQPPVVQPPVELHD